MVDILSQQQNSVGFDSKMESDEAQIEKGEDTKVTEDLPEEGEITDEDESESAQPAAETHSSSSRSRGHGNSSSHHRSHHHSPSRSSRSKPSSHGSSSTAKHAPKTSKYKDFSGKPTKPVASDEVMIESWINGVNHRKKTSPIYDSNEEYYSGGQTADVEMKDSEQSIQPAIMDEYGDVDYRQQMDTDAEEPKRSSRRRSASPIDGFGTMAKRPRNDSGDELHYPPPARRGPVKNRWTERTICKFFREGFCREGETCIYSHNAADSNRRPELCRFYAQGYCKRGLACPNLHGEYPCKAFHKGECSKEQCQFSHQSLNEYTTPIFEQMIRDEELAKKLLNSAGIRPRRRVLLPDGPVEWDTYFYEEKLTENRPTLPPPGVVIPTLSNGAQPKPAIPPAQAPKSSSFGFFNAVPSHSTGRVPSTHPNSSPHQISQQAPPVVQAQPKQMSPPQIESFSLDNMLGRFGQTNTAKSSAPSGSLSPSLIHDSLQSLQSMFDTNIVDESPRSPPQSGIVVSDSAPVIPTSRGYVAYPLHVPDTCSSLDLNLIQQLTSGLYKNDPRLKRMAEKQFDLVSKTLEQQGGVQAILNQQKAATNVLPGVSRQNAIPSFQPPVQASVSIPSSAAHPLPIDPRARDPRTISRVPPATTDLPPALYPPESDEFKSMVEQQIKMANEMNKVKPTDVDMRVSSSSNYGSSPRAGDSPYYEQRPEVHPPSYRGQGRFGGRGAPTQRGHTSRFNRHGDDHSGKRYHSKEDRNWNENSTDSQPNPKSASPPTRPTDAAQKEEQARNSAPLTLREKRKDNQFESPLASRRF